mmetsp:Transcript_108426/g.315294  ORF Transcript_108426/g.315294 Transcript_108426/m.315294 type:complete len:139 (+) Transcript_108426:145-561(+)
MGSGGSKPVEVEEEISAFTKEEEWRNDQGLQYTVIVVKGHEGSKASLMGRYINEGQTYNGMPIFVKRQDGKGYMYYSSTGKWNLAFKRSDLGENLGAIGSAEPAEKPFTGRDNGLIYKYADSKQKCFVEDKLITLEWE